MYLNGSTHAYVFLVVLALVLALVIFTVIVAFFIILAADGSFLILYLKNER